MNVLPLSKRAQIIGLLVEGNSMRATARLADVSLNTVSKFLADVGAACAEYQDKAFHNLPCKRIQCDEIWSFVGAKEKNASEAMRAAGNAGDVWTWTAICADTKLMPCWAVGARNAAVANEFMDDLASRLTNRVQLTTDGNRTYLDAVKEAFVGQVDYAMLVKQYGAAPGIEGTRRYSPAECTGAIKQNVSGNPEGAHISTSYVERANLTMRMGMRRFTRLTNAFSKKVEAHASAVALHFMYYNFGRVHKTLRVTPAMEAGISDHVWTHAEIAALVVDKVPTKRGPYKKREISN
ncbi:IS1 family transposase [Solimonas terrae]|uniref:IS1 family transposase n=1 Tax=Solimonas terrae TaxID=1396819 RepID=A0A6M2BVJ6_9GAMM|nr:IS1 family transposase [Solimonas terrae]NGY06153.1 IS1 family transposase [Solimonas terrae]